MRLPASLSPKQRTRAAATAHVGLSLLLACGFSTEVFGQTPVRRAHDRSVQHATAARPAPRSTLRRDEFPISSPTSVFRFDDDDQFAPLSERTRVQQAALEAPDGSPSPPGPFVPDEVVAELPRQDQPLSMELTNLPPPPKDGSTHRAIRSAGPSRITAASTWPDSATPANDFDAGTMLAGMVRGSLLVAALLGATLWALRWWMKNKSGAFVGHGGLNVISSLALAGRCHLQLVDARGQQVLIGIDAGGIKCVTLLPERFETSFDEASRAFDRPDAEPAERA